jgi:hypothetical protein
MKNVILHIGLPKTGSTTIQNTLHFNRSVLKAQTTYRYARWKPNHSDYMSLLFYHDAVSDPNLIALGLTTEAKREKARARQLHRFRLQLKDCPEDHTLILSAEKAADFQPEDIERFRSALADNGARLTRVICYVRNPLSYTTSMVQQRLKVSGTLDMLEYAPPVPPFRRWIEPWLETCGRQMVDIRLFEEALIAPGGLVGDFLTALGLPRDVVKKQSAETRNESLSLEAALIVDAVNKERPLIKGGKLSPGRHRQDVNNLLQGIPGTRFQMGQRFADRVREKSHEDVLWLEGVMGRSPLFSDTAVDQDPEPEWSEETRRELGLLIFSLYAELQALKHELSQYQPEFET